MKEQIKLCCYYAKRAVCRWFSPRAYIVAYTYEKDNGTLVHESKVIRAVRLPVDNLVQYLTDKNGSYTLHIDSITEYPGEYKDLPIVDLVEYAKNKALNLAKEIKEEKSPALSLGGAENEPDEQNDISVDTKNDLDNFLSNR